MKKRIIENNKIRMAIINDTEPIFTDIQSAIDVMATIEYYDNCHNMIFYKSAIQEEFFDLSTGLAGEILQNFVNYGWKIAIIGEFSNYKSNALKDFIYECNNGNNIFFVASESEATVILTAKS